jgi:catechol 2,3-dioxygenase-like lactoylglutathione lyase family enzyme
VRDVVEIALFTDDVAATAAFYGELVGSAPVAEWPGGAIFAAGGTKILVHEHAAALEDGPPNEDHFAISVADLDQSCAMLQTAGVLLLVEPRAYPWGRSAYLRDPDGRLVELAES